MRPYRQPCSPVYVPLTNNAQGRTLFPALVSPLVVVSRRMPSDGLTACSSPKNPTTSSGTSLPTPCLDYHVTITPVPADVPARVFPHPAIRMRAATTRVLAEMPLGRQGYLDHAPGAGRSARITQVLCRIISALQMLSPCCCGYHGDEVELVLGTVSHASFWKCDRRCFARHADVQNKGRYATLASPDT